MCLHTIGTAGTARKGSQLWEGRGELGTFVPHWWDCKMVQLLWETVQRFLSKGNVEFPWDSAAFLLRGSPVPRSTGAHTGTRVCLFTVVLFGITNSGGTPGAHGLM